MEIQLVKKPIKAWKAFDFVIYFYDKCQQIYGVNNYPIDVNTDCFKIKNMINIFESHNRSKTVLKQFLDLGINDYVNSKKKYALPITIGFLTCRIEDFLQIKLNRKKKVRPKIRFSEETTNWIKEQKKMYKIGDLNAR